MLKSYLKLFFSYIVISTLVGCSYSDLTDLWPSGADSEEEIVIREIPDESFDPEDTEEIIITKVEDNEEREEPVEIDIISDESEDVRVEEENLDSLFSQNDNNLE